MQPLLKKRKIQYSARITRWLDRLNHFYTIPKYTAGKEIKFTKFISHNPTENAEAEDNYEEEFVIHAIAQLATVNCRIGRDFNQSESAKIDETTDMFDTQEQTGSRCRKTNKSHSHSNSIADQIAINSHRDTGLQANMDNDNKNNRQNPDKINCNADRYTGESTLRYHWGADDEIMRIINRRDNSPETSELAERRIERTRLGHMRYQWHKKLDREILLPRRTGDADRKESKCSCEEKKNAAIQTSGADISKISKTKSHNELPHDQNKSGYHYDKTCRRHRIDGFIITRRTGHYTRTGGLPGCSRTAIP